MEQSLLDYQSSYENGLLILNGILLLILAIRTYLVFQSRSTRNWLWNGQSGSFVLSLKMVFLLAQICIWIAIPHLFLFISTFRIFVHEWLNQLFVFLWLAIATQEMILCLTYSAKLKTDFVKRILFFLLSIFWFLGFGLSALLAERVWALPQSDKSITIGFPVKGTWRVMHGGASITTNVHGIDSTECYAIDLIKTNEEGLFFNQGGMALTDLFGFRDAVFAPVSGKVVAILDTLDNQAVLHPLDTLHPNGNELTILTNDGFLVKLSHLDKSLNGIQLGNSITKGQLIGRCGSSGNTPWPLLQIQVNHLQNKKSVPFQFEQIQYKRWGCWQTCTDTYLLRNDFVNSLN
jgi:hypothetical protein